MKKFKNKIISIMSALLIVFVISISNDAAFAAENNQTLDFTDLQNLDVNKNTVDIISFNDLHGSVQESGKNIGIAKLSSVINQYKSKESSSYGVIPVCGGDSYQGSAISNLEKGAPVSETYKEIGIAASAIGNHEFDWGSDCLTTWAQDGGFTFLAANIVNKNTNKTPDYAKPYTIIEKNGVKIGIIGISTLETVTSTKAENISDVNFLDPVETLNKYAKIVRNEGADTVIALTHCASYQSLQDGSITGEASEIAKNVQGIDAIVSAHSHQFVSGKVNGVSIVQGGYNGRGIGRLRFVFDKNNKLESIEPSCIKFAGNEANIAEDQKVKDILQKYLDDLNPLLLTKVTTLEERLDNEGKYKDLTPLGIITCETLRRTAGTDIYINNGGGFRKSLEKGDVTVGDMYELLPFDNYIVTLKLKGEDVKKVLEHGINTTSYAWGQFAGVKVYYNKETGNINAVKMADGSDMDMEKEYTVAINDFMLTGGDQYDFSKATDAINTNICMRDAVIDYWTKNGIPEAINAALIEGNPENQQNSSEITNSDSQTDNSSDNSKQDTDNSETHKVSTDTAAHKNDNSEDSSKTGDNNAMLIMIFICLIPCSMVCIKKSKRITEYIK